MGILPRWSRCGWWGVCNRFIRNNILRSGGRWEFFCGRANAHKRPQSRLNESNCNRTKTSRSLPLRRPSNLLMASVRWPNACIWPSGGCLWIGRPNRWALRISGTNVRIPREHCCASHHCKIISAAGQTHPSLYTVHHHRLGGKKKRKECKKIQEIKWKQGQ